MKRQESIEDYVLKAIDEYRKKFLDKIKKESISKDFDLINQHYLSSKYHVSSFSQTEITPTKSNNNKNNKNNNNSQDFQDSIPESNNNVFVEYTYGKDFQNAKQDPTKRTTEPPFPFNYIYSQLDYLDYQLFQKIRALQFL